MGNRFGIQGLGAEAVHSIRDVNDARISEVSRPTEGTKEAVHSEFAASYSGASNEGQETRSIFCCPEDVRKSEFAESYTILWRIKIFKGWWQLIKFGF